MPGRFGFGVRMGLHNIPSQRQAGTHALYPYPTTAYSLVHSLKIHCDIFMIGFPPATPSDGASSKTKRVHYPTTQPSARALRPRNQKMKTRSFEQPAG